MSEVRFEPIAERTAEIVEAVMATDEIRMLSELEFSLRLVVEELVSNIVNYSTSPMINIVVQRLDNVLRLTILDHGIPFNPLKQKAPDLSLSVEERELGGLGIFLVREIMSRISYSYEDETNILTIEKDL